MNEEIQIIALRFKVNALYVQPYSCYASHTMASLDPVLP